jgi:hypothetical protein
MLAELILIGKLLGKTNNVVVRSTPSPVVRPKFFPKPTKPKTITPPTKEGPALGLKKYF